MYRQARIILVEDDYYSRSFMEMLLRRDFRTSIIGDAGNPIKLHDILTEKIDNNDIIDLLLIDTEVPDNREWLRYVLKQIESLIPIPRIIFTCNVPNNDTYTLLRVKNCAGYIKK